MSGKYHTVVILVKVQSDPDLGQASGIRKLSKIDWHERFRPTTIGWWVLAGQRMPPIEEWPSFIHTRIFDEDWAELGLNDADLSRLQHELVGNPEAGSVVKGAGGLRKVRFAPRHSGKSGGLRVCYSNYREYGIILLAIVYDKREQSDLERTETKAIARLFKRFEDQLSKG